MFQEKPKIKGLIEIYRVRNGIRDLIFSKCQTINSTLYTSLRDKLVNYDSGVARGAGVDGITWGSFSAPGGTFVDGTYAGTFAAGTAGALIRTTPTSQQAKFSGTFSFLSTKNVNYFELGQGFTAAGAGVTQLTTSRYAYDNSLNTGSTWLVFENGDSQIVDWTIQIGS